MSLKTKLFALILLSGSFYFVSASHAGPLTPKPANLPSCYTECVLQEEQCENNISTICAHSSDPASCQTEQMDECVTQDDNCQWSCGL